MVHKKIVGIYYFKNKINEKGYVGQSRNITRRKCAHKYSINNPKQYFSHALKKYGWENFEFKIICKLPLDTDQETIDEKEIHFIKEYNTFGPNGYNLTSGGKGNAGSANGMFGKKHNKNTKNIIKEKRKRQVGRLCPGYGKPSKRRKVIYAREIGETEWKEYPYAGVAAKELGITNSFIVNCLKGRKKSSKYEFTYQNCSPFDTL